MKDDLDPLIHASSRLRIMTTLVTLSPGDSLSFNALRDVLAMTGGNLSTHLAKLESGGYVSVSKSFQGRKPVTFVHATDAGRSAFADYLTQLRELLGELPRGSTPADQLDR